MTSGPSESPKKEFKDSLRKVALAVVLLAATCAYHGPRLTAGSLSILVALLFLAVAGLRGATVLRQAVPVPLPPSTTGAPLCVSWCHAEPMSISPADVRAARTRGSS